MTANLAPRAIPGPPIAPRKRRVRAVPRPWLLVRLTFILFVASIPFEGVRVVGVASLPRLIGWAFFFVALMQPDVCFRRPPAAFWWFVTFVAIFLVRAFIGRTRRSDGPEVARVAPRPALRRVPGGLESASLPASLPPLPEGFRLLVRAAVGDAAGGIDDIGCRRPGIRVGRGPEQRRRGSVAGTRGRRRHRVRNERGRPLGEGRGLGRLRCHQRRGRSERPPEAPSWRWRSASRSSCSGRDRRGSDSATSPSSAWGSPRSWCCRRLRGGPQSLGADPRAGESRRTREDLSDRPADVSREAHRGLGLRRQRRRSRRPAGRQAPRHAHDLPLGPDRRGTDRRHSLLHRPLPLLPVGLAGPSTRLRARAPSPS